MGRNLLDVLSGRRDDLELITFNSIPNAPSLFEYDKVLISPSLVEDGDGFRKFFLEKIRAEKPNLIIPCRDEDVEFLSKIKSENLLIEYPILTGSFEIASSFLDKWKSFEFSKVKFLRTVEFSRLEFLSTLEFSRIEFLSTLEVSMLESLSS